MVTIAHRGFTGVEHALDHKHRRKHYNTWERDARAQQDMQTKTIV